MIDGKYDLNRHPRIHLSADGGAPVYDYAPSDGGAFAPGAVVYINEPGISEDEIAGEFTFNQDAVIRVPVRQQPKKIKEATQKGKKRK